MEPSDDFSAPSDCIAFYRPSFGRKGGNNRAEFGEFDAIIVSSKKIYLVESKWDQHKSNERKSRSGKNNGFDTESLGGI